MVPAWFKSSKMVKPPFEIFSLLTWPREFAWSGTQTFSSVRTKVTDNDKISTLVRSERYLNFGNLLTLGIYIFRLVLF